MTQIPRNAKDRSCVWQDNKHQVSQQKMLNFQDLNRGMFISCKCKGPHAGVGPSFILGSQVTVGCSVGEAAREKRRRPLLLLASVEKFHRSLPPTVDKVAHIPIVYCLGRLETQWATDRFGEPTSAEMFHSEGLYHNWISCLTRLMILKSLITCTLKPHGILHVKTSLLLPSFNTHWNRNPKIK